jgi:organic radical activating enzyme
MKDLLDGYIQQLPFTVLIEPTEGCNLGCSFCGLRGMREKGTKPWNFMTIKTAEIIAKEIKRVGWKSKIVFAQHGEPTLNPNFLSIVSVFRNLLPDNIFHIYSNGYTFNRFDNKDDYVNLVFDSGIDNIIIDCYSSNGDWNFINELKTNKDKIVFYDKGVNLYTTSHKKRLLIMPPIQDKETNLITRKLANHAGAAAPKDFSYNNKRCAMPFRELAFRWDGNVAICCDDFRGEYPIANIKDMSIEDLWNHPKFQAARVMLYNKDRNFTPCNGCTNVSMRVGFLPDYRGQDELPKISDEIRKIAMENCKNGSLSIIVKRPWEK